MGVWLAHTGWTKKNLVLIPNTKNYSTYKKSERREKWIESIFEFINSEDLPTESNNACYWILKFIYKKCPKDL